MAANLDAFKTAFSNTYQEIFQKVPVGMKIANTRLLSDLYYGKAIERVYIDIDSAQVQDIVAYTDMTSAPVSDTAETLSVNKNKGIMFQVSERELTQAGPLNPGEFIGSKLAQKVALYFDGDILAETRNALYSFDNGDLTTASSDGTPITLSSTTVPQMVMRLPAKLRAKNNQVINAGANMAFVIDSYGIADTFQYLLGKNADFVNALFQNGYVNEQVAGAKVYVSEALTGEIVITYSGQPSHTETLVLGGVTLTAVSTIVSTAGNFLIGADADATYANLTGLINAPSTTSSTQVALSAANQIVFASNLRLAATQDATANTVTITAVGAGRVTATDGLSNATLVNFINSYFGKEGAIDAVMQKDVKAEMRPEPKQPTTNVISRVLYGIKTFNDGAKKFLRVKIAV